MNILRLLTLLVLFTASHAQRPVSLPQGDIVSYGGTQCGQVKDEWVPGQIQKNGTFLSFSAQISRLNKQKKATRDPAKRKKLDKQIKGLRSRANSQAATCLLFGPRVNKPKGTQSALPGYTEISWTHNVATYAEGSEHNFFCPPNGEGNSIWGTYIYTADSSICKAAVHTGLFNARTGGNVRVRVKSGQSYYLPSLRNSIKSSEYGYYSKSFVFLNPTDSSEISSTVPPVISWNVGLTGLPLDTVEQFVCPANGTKGSLWGTDIYTNDSDVCTAAVHARKVSFRRGGPITVRIRAGQSSYIGSTRNGVTSSSYGAWGGSFSFE